MLNRDFSVSILKWATIGLPVKRYFNGDAGGPIVAQACMLVWFLFDSQSEDKTQWYLVIVSLLFQAEFPGGRIGVVSVDPSLFY